MIYLFYREENDEKAKVHLTYYVTPPEELLETSQYIAIEKLQEAERKEGKLAELYCNPKTEEVWYEYRDEPDREDTDVEEKFNELENSLAARDEKIKELEMTLGSVLMEISSLKSKGEK